SPSVSAKTKKSGKSVIDDAFARLAEYRTLCFAVTTRGIVFSATRKPASDTEAAWQRRNRRKHLADVRGPVAGKLRLTHLGGAGVLRLHFRQHIAAHNDIIMSVLLDRPYVTGFQWRALSTA